MSEGYNKIVRE